MKDRYAKEPVLEVLQRQRADGTIERLKLIEVRAKVHYPRIRVREIWRQESATGAFQLLRQESVVADHLMVRLKPGIPLPQVRELARALGAEVLTPPQTTAMNSPFLLVAFDGNDLSAMDRIGEALRRQPEFTAVSPDSIAWIAD